MKNFARLDEAELKKVDVNEGLRSTLEMVSREMGERIRVIDELGDVPRVVCYPGRLNQAFLTLLLNAVQAIEKEGYYGPARPREFRMKSFKIPCKLAMSPF